LTAIPEALNHAAGPYERKHVESSLLPIHIATPPGSLKTRLGKPITKPGAGCDTKETLLLAPGSGREQRCLGNSPSLVGDGFGVKPKHEVEMWDRIAALFWPLFLHLHSWAFKRCAK
jgi:hypothetical protein